MTKYNILLVTDDRLTISGGLGRASIVTVAGVETGRVATWEEHAVPWRERRDTEPHGIHHDTILQFLREHDAHAVVADHVGAGIRSQLRALGIAVFEYGGIAAQAAALAAAAVLSGQLAQGGPEPPM